MRLTTIIALLAAVLLLAAGCSGGGTDSPAPSPGGMAPDFQLQNLDGETVTLSGLRGTPVMLNFWATWCPPCRGEMPFIQEAYQNPAWKESGVKIMAVNIGESQEDVQDFMDTLALSFPVLLDKQQNVAKSYNVGAIPTTFFIDEEGMIKYVKIGAFRNVSELDGLLESLVSGTD